MLVRVTFKGSGNTILTHLAEYNHCRANYTLSVLADERACLGNAAFDEGGLNFKLLTGPQIHCGLERQVTRQGDAHAMGSRGEEHCFS